MSSRKGKIVYVPKIVIEELDCIRKEDDISRNSEAFEKMVKNSRIGRVTRRNEDINPLGLPKKRRRADPLGGMF
jgi:predicted ribonuclease YlaK